MGIRFLPASVVASFLALLVLAGGCTSGSPDEPVSSSLIRLDLQKSDERRLIEYYLGGYLGPEGGDPFEQGMVVENRGRFYLDLDTLHSRFPDAAGSLDDHNRNDRIEWEELAAFLQATYREARALSPSLSAFRSDHDYRDRPDEWFAVELNGVMTAARRRIHVPVDALRAALREYWINEERLLYPSGTAIVGEHFIDGSLVETTAMVKRADGYWDFLTYGEDGSWSRSTSTPPRPLDVPTQCVGCHFGSRQFEPERSFPKEAGPGPQGPRALYVEPSLRDAEVTAFFEEHTRRSDTVLGLYNTLFVARLRAERNASGIGAPDADILESLSL